MADTNTAAAIKVLTVGTASVLALAANGYRRQFILFNDSGRKVLVAYGPTASPTNFSFDIKPNEYFKSDLNDYTGVISVAGLSGSGPLRVTEIQTTPQ